MSTPNPEADTLRGEINRTREELQVTVDALATELSPRIQAQRAAGRTKQAVAQRPAIASAVGVAAVAVLVAVPLWRRSR